MLLIGVKKMGKKKGDPEKEIWGLDLVDMTPDYTKSHEENKEIWARRYKEVYGKWPPCMSEGSADKVKEPEND